MALLQFMTAGLPEVAVPTTVHCDHLIQAQVGADTDLQSPSTSTARSTTSCAPCRPSTASASGSRARDHPPGRARALRLPRRDDDRHRQPHAQRRRAGHGRHRRGRRRRGRRDGRLPVRRALAPQLIGVRLTGQLSGWTVAEGRHPQGGRDPHREGRHRRHRRVLRARAPTSISATGKATICNMGAEIGATTSVFPYDEARRPLPQVATGREAIADAADRRAEHLRADDEVDGRPRRALRPGHRDRPRHPRAPRRSARTRPTWPTPVVAPGRRRQGRGLAAAAVAAPSSARAPTRPTRTSPGPPAWPARPRPAACGRRRPCSSPPAPSRCGPRSSATACWPTSRPSAPPCWPTPAGRASASGPATDVADGEVNSIINSFNRNFPKRNDGNAKTLAFIASPETVVAYALAGTLDFNPPDRRARRRPRSSRPSARSCPSQGFDAGEAGFIAPPEDGAASTVVVDPDSDRLQLLEPFPPGTARTSSSCRCCSRPRASAPPTTSRPPGRGCSTAATWRTSAATCSSAPSTPSPATAGDGQGPARRRDQAAARRRPALPRRRACLGGRRRRELRRGLVPRARGHGAPVPRRPGDHRPLLRPHRRDQPQEAGRAAARRSPTPPPTTRSARTTGSRCSAWPAWRPTARCSCRDPPARRLRRSTSSPPTPCPHEQIEWFRAGSALNIIRQRFEE